MRALHINLDLDEMLPGSKIGKLSSLRYFSDIIEIERAIKKKKCCVLQKYRVHSLTPVTEEVASCSQNKF